MRFKFFQGKYSLSTPVCLLPSLTDHKRRSMAEGVEKREPSYTVGGNAN